MLLIYESVGDGRGSLRSHLQNTVEHVWTHAGAGIVCISCMLSLWDTLSMCMCVLSVFLSVLSVFYIYNDIYIIYIKISVKTHNERIQKSVLFLFHLSTISLNIWTIIQVFFPQCAPEIEGLNNWTPIQMFGNDDPKFMNVWTHIQM